MELQAVVKAFFSKFDKIGDRFGRVFFKKFHGHGAVVCGNVCVHAYRKFRFWLSKRVHSSARIKKASRTGRLFIERETRFELATPTLARLCSTTELFSHTAVCFQTEDGKFTEV